MAELVIGPDVIAAVAAQATLATPGVLRLEPGVAELIGGWGRAARQQVLGMARAASTGVTVADGPVVRVSVSVTGRAADVGQAVQRAVAAAVEAGTGESLAGVEVSIVDIVMAP
ncbi:Asp23/Gls24 family envelope stress response protein [Fodinicola acaciae]|uniref:Asp23/Gls24 family envelope stress response protein n=1 Tax=Fodinicola acaciae TaxID=2681555 RepID=UPI0013D3864B|nr:Asp23/Gls24 family envelope stress response protein [Fodinicola acaciae]